MERLYLWGSVCDVSVGVTLLLVFLLLLHAVVLVNGGCCKAGVKRKALGSPRIPKQPPQTGSVDKRPDSLTTQGFLFLNS